MRTTVDIADEKYSRLKSEAAVARTSVKSLISEGVDLVLRERELSRASRKTTRPPWPVIAGGNPEALARITNDAMFGFDDEA
jgi:hypothetical protein